MTDYPFHPLANIFPLLEGGEFAAFIEDIRAHGLHEPIVIFENQIFDGRNRDRACRAAGIEPRYVEKHFASHAEAVAYVISKNIHRRHLTAEQKRELIEKLLKVDPIKSNRQIAGDVGVSKGTVGAVRKKLEAKGDVANLATLTDTKGRRQPRRRSKPASSNPEPASAPQTGAPAMQGNGLDPAASAETMKARHAAIGDAEAATPDAPAPVSASEMPLEQPVEESPVVVATPTTDEPGEAPLCTAQEKVEELVAGDMPAEEVVTLKEPIEKIAPPSKGVRMFVLREMKRQGLVKPIIGSAPSEHPAKLNDEPPPKVRLGRGDSVHVQNKDLRKWKKWAERRIKNLEDKVLEIDLKNRCADGTCATTD